MGPSCRTRMSSPFTVVECSRGAEVVAVGGIEPYPMALMRPHRDEEIRPDQIQRILASVPVDLVAVGGIEPPTRGDRKSTRLNSSHLVISYAVFCLKKKKKAECNLSF